MYIPSAGAQMTKLAKGLPYKIGGDALKLAAGRLPGVACCPRVNL